MEIVVIMAAISILYGLWERKYLVAATGALALGYLMVRSEKNLLNQTTFDLQSRLDDAILSK